MIWARFPPRATRSMVTGCWPVASLSRVESTWLSSWWRTAKYDARAASASVTPTAKAMRIPRRARKLIRRFLVTAAIMS